MKTRHRHHEPLGAMNTVKHHLVILAVMGMLFMVCEVIIRVIGYPAPGRIDMTVMSFWAFCGYTSLWMFPVGGVCGLLIGLMNEKILAAKLPSRLQVLLGGVIITAIELVSGLVLNVWLDLGIWDYSTFPLNFMGQICLPASLLWVAMTPLAMWIDDVLRFYLIGGHKPETLWKYYRDLFCHNPDA